MKFEIVPHNPKLNIYVKSMWCIENSIDQSNSNYVFKEYITFACAFPNLVFQISGEDFLKTSLKGKSIFIPRNHFTGIIKSPMDIASRGPFKLFGISFFPHVFKSLFNINSDDTINQVLNIQSVLPNLDLNLIDVESNTTEIAQEIITNHLLEIMAKQDKVDPILDAAISFILINKGQATISDLAAYLGFSIRHIERIFKKYVGVSPKDYSSILRFQNTISLNAKKDNDNLTQMAIFYGYSDQSHFIREFKRFTTLKPKDYYFNNDNIGVGFVKY